MTRPIAARISLDALSENLSRVRDYAPGSGVLSVVKANAYGHGLLPVAGALSDSDGYALLDLDDALKLRASGFRQKIVLLEGFFSIDELQAISENGIDVVVHSVEQIDMLASGRLTGKINLFLKCNTGMNRLGFRPDVLSDMLCRLGNCGKIVLMTHFSSADGEEGVSRQMNAFDAATASMGFPRSLANSAALIRYPETRADWVRPGIMLYGASPFPEVKAETLGLKPAMTLVSRIIAVQEVKAGESVGYGAMFRAERPMRIGIVACGYADGYPRHAPNGTPVLVAGRLTGTMGRVSMDMLYVDITGIGSAGIGTEVVLWGAGLPVEDVAKACGTISYELLCALASRVPVTYY
ncbi:MAG: alanine racemase [Burkholderiales bacterium]|nr:alanine racemase [Burkholderiales bacterium]